MLPEVPVIVTVTVPVVAVLLAVSVSTLVLVAGFDILPEESAPASSSNRMWRAAVTHRTNAVPRDLVPDQWKNDKCRQQNGPEPKSIACQQLLFLRDINRNLNDVSFS
jgi:hypothetical protein